MEIIIIFLLHFFSTEISTANCVEIVITIFSVFFSTAVDSANWASLLFVFMSSESRFISLFSVDFFFISLFVFCMFVCLSFF